MKLNHGTYTSVKENLGICTMNDKKFLIQWFVFGRTTFLCYS